MAGISGLGAFASIVGAFGGLAGLGVIIKAVLDHRKGVQGQELDADERLLARLEREIDRKDAIINRKDEAYDTTREELRKANYNIVRLQAHILEDKGPPPPDLL